MTRRFRTLVALMLLTCRISMSERLCYEFFYLVQQWGPTFCKHDRQACHTQPISSQFTLHGLWPNYQKGHCPGKPGAWPQNCDDSSTDLPPECDCPFDQDLITDLVPSMAENWPGYGDTNADFWKHEWDKHGSCAITYEKAIGGPVTEEHDYFAKALQLHSQCNVLESFEAAGIQVGSPASTASLIGAIKQSCGVEPQIACHYGTADLQEVRICYDDQFVPIDCQQARLVEGCKGKQIVLPDWQEASATS